MVVVEEEEEDEGEGEEGEGEGDDDEGGDEGDDAWWRHVVGRFSRENVAPRFLSPPNRSRATFPTKSLFQLFREN